MNRTLIAISFLALVAVVTNTDGKALSSFSPPDSGSLIVVTSDTAVVTGNGAVLCRAEKGRWFGVVSRADDRIEIRICDDLVVRQGFLPAKSVAPLMDKDVNLPRKVALLAKSLNPQLDVDQYHRELTSLIDGMAQEGSKGRTARDQVRRMTTYLFDIRGFSAKENIRLDQILDEKGGDCLHLSLFYLCAAHEIDLPLRLVATPYHSFIRFEGEGEEFNVEATEKGEIHGDDSYLADHLGHQKFGQLSPEHLKSITDAQCYAVLLSKCGSDMARAGMTRAQRQYQTAVELFPRYANAYYNLGVYLDKLGAYEQACQQYAEASVHAPKFVSIYDNWRQSLRDLGRYAEACEKAAKAVSIDPDDAELWSDWGVSLMDQNKMTEAYEKFEKAVVIDPRCATAYSNWAVLLLRTRRYLEAAKKCSVATQIDPISIHGFATWGLVLLDAGEPAAACVKFERAVELGENSSVTYCSWGVALARTEKFWDACEKYRKAVEIDTHNADAYCGWGVSLVALGKPDEACKKYHKAAEVNPQQQDVYYNWGVALGKMGRDAEACEKYAQDIRINPKRTSSYFNWGNTLLEMGRTAEACQKLEQAVALDPKHAKAYLSWGIALGEMGKGNEAVAKFEQALRIDPQYRSFVARARQKYLPDR